jgi:hypothetical protein
LLQPLDALLQFFGFLDLALQLYQAGAGIEDLVDDRGVTSIYSPGEDASGEVL